MSAELAAAIEYIEHELTMKVPVERGIISLRVAKVRLVLAAARQSVPVTTEKPPQAMFMWGVLLGNGTPLERPEVELLERKLHARFTITRKPTETEEKG